MTFPRTETHRDTIYDDTHWTHDSRLPLEQVVADRSGRTRAGRITSEVDEFLEVA